MAEQRHQLGFPWCEEALRPIAVGELRGTGCVRFEVREGLNEVALWLAIVSNHQKGDYWYAEDRFEVRLRLAHPVWCRINGTRSSWDMERACSPELLFVGPDAGPFADAVEWALYQLEPSSRNAFRDEEVLALEKPWRRSLLQASNVVADRGLAMCDARALQRASSFHPDVRLFVYGALVADASPRTEQMIETCPGLLVMAGDRSDTAVLEGIVRGARLTSLVSAIVPSRTDSRTAAILIRRADRSHSPSTLRAAIAAVGIDINDMPKDQDARRRWYETVAECQRQQRSLPARADRERFGAFVSKNALELDAIAEARYLPIDSVLTEIIDWNVHGPGTVPSRRSSVRRVLEAVTAWHAGLWAGPTIDPQTKLPIGPVPTAAIAGISVEPIKTVGELVAEGAVMHHCVGGYAERALEGHVFLYKGKVRRQRVTLAIASDGSRWRLVDVAGFANRPPDDPALVHRWIDALPMVGARGASPDDGAL